jgi:hypothetical protein
MRAHGALALVAALAFATTAEAALFKKKPPAPAVEDAADLVSADLPASLETGAEVVATVTMKNTGSATWRRESHRLGAVGDEDPLSPDGRIYLDPGETVAPGATRAFKIRLVGRAAGRVTTDWQMVHEGVRWFGAIARREVTVTPRVVQEDDAVLVAATFPGSLVTGASGRAELTFRNTGSASWSRKTGHRLCALDDSDPFYKLDTRVDLPDGVTIAPGATHTFVIPLEAPLGPGSYVSDWRLVREAVRFFGPTVKQTIEVRGERKVDASTLEKKLLMGYQGWFRCKGDGSPDGWDHWSRGDRNARPNPSTVSVDLWPDVSELDKDELYDTDFTFRDGRRAQLFSSYSRKTVGRHFKWMKDYGIDGVTIGRFTVGVSDKGYLESSRHQLELIRSAAEEHGRVFMIAYDITGHPEASLVRDIQRDWEYLVKTLRVTESPSYLKHRGKPLVMIWGLGASDRPGTAPQAMELIRFIKENPDPSLRGTVMGGVSWGWRTMEACKPDPAWAQVYRSFDVINPWIVAAFATEGDADSWYRDRLAPDVEECKRHGIDYVPVVFPGFSWKNLQSGRAQQNGIPRQGGKFYWRQVWNAVRIGSTAILNAMFDEVDEGTAMFKMAPTRDDLPAQGEFLPLDADGYRLPSDWYLRLAGEAQRLLRGEIPLDPRMPLTPP